MATVKKEEEIGDINFNDYAANIKSIHEIFCILLILCTKPLNFGVPFILTAPLPLV